MEMTDNRIFITSVQFKGQDSNCVNMTDDSIDSFWITGLNNSQQPSKLDHTVIIPIYILEVIWFTISWDTGNYEHFSQVTDHYDWDFFVVFLSPYR
jgi:hypothetical protein